MTIYKATYEFWHTQSPAPQDDAITYKGMQILWDQMVAATDKEEPRYFLIHPLIYKRWWRSISMSRWKSIPWQKAERLGLIASIGLQDTISDRFTVDKRRLRKHIRKAKRSKSAS